MARTPVTHPESMVAPKEFILPDDWDKKLKKQFTAEQKIEVEHIVYRYIEQSRFDKRRLDFDEVEYRCNHIIEGASQILKGYLYPHTHYSSDGAHLFIERELTHKLSELNGAQFDSPPFIMHQILDLKDAAEAALSDLKKSHPKKSDGRPTNNNADQLIYKLGKYFEKCGGKFAMPKSPSLTHPFYTFLQAINEHIDEDFRLSDNDLVNRSIKIIRKIKK